MLVLEQGSGGLMWFVWYVRYKSCAVQKGYFHQFLECKSKFVTMSFT